MARRRHRVEFSETANRDLLAIRDTIARDRPAAAANWLRKVKQKVLLLHFAPLAFEVIPEAEELGREVRHIILGNYRILYQVHGERVLIHCIIHAARRLTHKLLGPIPQDEE